MKSQAPQHVRRSPKRRWPFDLSVYDRSPVLTEIEIQALASVAEMREADNKFWLSKNRNALARLLRPVDHVLDYIGVRDRSYYTGTKSNLLRAMHQRQTCYWSWSSADWVEVLGSSYKDFGKDCAYQSCRINLIAFSYLISNFTELHLYGSHSLYGLARRVFGEQALLGAIETVRSELRKMGYSDARTVKSLPYTLSKAMLLARSPRLEDITFQILLKVRDVYSAPHVNKEAIRLSRALYGLGIITETVKPRSKSFRTKQATDTVSPEWVNWCKRWKETSTLEPITRKGIFHSLIKTGRWLSKFHPEVSSPQDWTYELAAEYTAALTRAKIGDWASAKYVVEDKKGKPFSANSIAGYLAIMRIFFRDCAEWGWVQLQLDTHRAFRTPSSVRAKIGPDPRVISDDIWAKLLWAGLNLAQTDLPDCYARSGYYYPLELVKAVAVVWLFAGLRVSEIIRLRVGCIRWQREDVTVPGTDEILPKEAVCWLDVPVNKTKHAFTKPVDVAVGEAVAAWEMLRLKQPPTLDMKTGEIVNYLFCYRGRPIGITYINNCLIPLLCKKAGVPERDARGYITSHRARSTIATQLYNSREPMNVFELQEWMGHRSPNTTQHYARVNPTKLAKKYEKAGYFKRNVRTIEVLIDRDAIVSGAASQGEPWQYYDLGHGWCTNAYFVECPHRMACPKCQFYVPKDSAKGQFIEGQANLQLMLQHIPLTDDERAAVEEGVEIFESLCQRLADVPTPAGPTPRQLIQLTRSVNDDFLQKGQIVKSRISKP